MALTLTPWLAHSWAARLTVSGERVVGMAGLPPLPPEPPPPVQAGRAKSYVYVSVWLLVSVTDRVMESLWAVDSRVSQVNESW
jgi:hypothetical protein